MSSPQQSDECDIAIVGMAGRFPGARTLEEFWENLRDGVESITTFSDDELREAGVALSLINDARFVKAAPVLEDADCFDGRFFGYSPLESELMDPQQRLFLECCHEALESAGYDPARFERPIGVFAGSAMNTYLLFSGILSRFTSDYLQTLIANDKDFLSTKVSYKLNLRGPSLTVQTACSTSLVAVHLACQSLLNQECDMALAGAMSVRVPLATGHLHTAGSVFSSDGHCRPFDANANGTIFGSGGGVVLLRRLRDALEAGDSICAVIKGSAVNNDGANKSEYTAPSIGRQADVIAEALGAAGVDADSIGYIEAHGTGTYLGDPIEVAALSRAFQESTGRTQFCALGSVKSNIGHLDAAAGIAGLIKATLALQHRQLPPTVHFQLPNPEIDFESTPFFVSNSLIDWTSDGPRRAGVSSLGIGGTNAHVVLEEAVNDGVAQDRSGDRLLILSAKTEQARSTLCGNLSDVLESVTAPELSDVAFTLAVGREAHRERLAVVCADRTEAAELLRHPPSRFQRTVDLVDRRAVFLFPGQGAQYLGMGRGLYETWPVYRETLDSCAELFRKEIGVDLREFMLCSEIGSNGSGDRLTRTEFTQPALFCVQYSLAQQLMAWGIQPAALVGHSVGELVSVAVADAISVEEAVHLVAARGRLMQGMPAGEMLAVHLPAEELQAMLPHDLSIAAINSPALTVVSGPASSVAAIAERLVVENVPHRRLTTSHAFHSPMMEPVVGLFSDNVARVTWTEPRIAIMSTVLGDWADPRQVTSRGYWERNVRDTVRFSECIGQLLSDPAHVLIEVGPGTTLSTLVRQHGELGRNASVVSLMRHPRQEIADVRQLLQSLGELWLAGVEIDWEAFYGDQPRRRVRLPTYPFERTRHWPRRALIDEPHVEVESARPGTFPETDPGVGWSDSIPVNSSVSKTQSRAGSEESIEDRVTAVWQESLGIPGIAPDENFFQLGGTSLTAVEILADLQAAFKTDLPPRILYDAQTIAELSREISQRLSLAEAPAGKSGTLHLKITAIWREALGVDEIGITENFFELGGTSLTAVEILADLHAELGVQLPPRDLRCSDDCGAVASHRIANAVQRRDVTGGEHAPAIPPATGHELTGRHHDAPCVVWKQYSRDRLLPEVHARLRL